jgi:translation elongation factor EF-1alpha
MNQAVYVVEGVHTTSVHVVPISAIKGDRIQQTNALQIH